MSNAPPPTPPYQPSVMTHPAVVITQMILQFLTVCLTLYVAGSNNRNADKIDAVSNQQAKITTQQEVTATQTHTIKKAVESSAAKDAQATEIQLWSTWKYLETIALDTNDPVDTKKAAEAKLTYDDFVTKNRRKK